jgi:Mn-containing catalase
MKMFPSPRIPTDKIPESRPHIKRGEHAKLYRFSQEDFQEVVAVWNGEHPETGDELVVADVPHPIGAPAHDLPPQPAVFAPDYSFEEIGEIAQRLRTQAGLPDRPMGVVSQESEDLVASLVGRTGS